MKILNYYKQQFEKSRQLKDWFSWFSVDTWDRLSLSAKLSEPTVTETLVIDLERLIKNEFPRLPFRLFHAKNEPKNGNDLEIILPLGNDKYVIFPCQAKRLYSTEVYEQMRHHGQIEKLIKYAKSKGGYPIYLLYNCIADKEYIKKEYAKQVKYPEELGCSIISAEYILEKFSNKKSATELFKNPNFKDLHLPAKPLSIITDSMLPNFIKLLNKDWEQNSRFELKYYSLKEILNTNMWAEVNIKTTRKMFPNIFKNMLNTEDYTQPFEPVFRILLTEESIIF
jgi:hypothetical protein